MRAWTVKYYLLCKHELQNLVPLTSKGQMQRARKKMVTKFLQTNQHLLKFQEGQLVFGTCLIRTSQIQPSCMQK